MDIPGQDDKRVMLPKQYKGYAVGGIEDVLYRMISTILILTILIERKSV